MNEYDEADAQLWGEAPPRDALDRALRSEDPFYQDDDDSDDDPEAAT